MLRVSITLLALACASQAFAQDVRPQPPQRPLLQLSEADCRIAERRDPLIADPEAFIDSVAAYGLELNSYSERLMEWRSRQFRIAGRWSEQDEQAFAASLLRNEAFTNEAAASMSMAMDVLEPLTRFAEEGRADESKCLDLLETQGIFDRITASVERQWRMIDEAYAAEAGRLGINVD